MNCATSRRTEVRRRMPPLMVHLLLLGCGVLFMGCAGGSGSSGFDPLAAENAAIDRALQSQGCETIDGLMICASGSATPTPVSTSTGTPSGPQFTLTPSPSGTPGGVFTPTTTPTFSSPTPTTTLPIANPSATPTPTPVPSQPSVDIDIGPNDTIPCQRPAPGAPCIAVLTFHPIGAPADAGYRVAVRTVAPSSAWTILPAIDNSAAVEVDTSGPTYQIAVLLFLSEPGTLPKRVSLLSNTGADFAFVTPVLTPVETASASGEAFGVRMLGHGAR
jgi:hypothetical protein